MVFKTLKLTALSFLVTASLTSAATFNFLSSGPNVPSLTYTVDGISLTITTGTFGSSNGSNINFARRDLSQSDTFGLGSIARSSSSKDSETVDGRSGDDALIFTFDRLVSISEAFLEQVESEDYFSFGTVTEDWAFNRISDNEQAQETVDIEDLFGTVVGTRFAIGARHRDADFTLTGLSVFDQSATNTQIATPIPTPVVPLPATGLFLMAGLGAIGLAARKKR